MKISRSRVMSALLSAGVICLLAILATYSTSAQQTKGKGKGDAKAAVNSRISYPGYITGTVTSDKGPEAGVWVIAETNDLQTKMIKTVVTDDQGRYMLPDLPAVNYKVWAEVTESWIQRRSIRSRRPTQWRSKWRPPRLPQEAAKVYPGDYWLSLLAPPPKSMFPGTGEKSETDPNGNGLNVAMIRPGRMDQSSEVRLQLLPSAGQSAEPRCAARVRGQARPPQNPCGRLGMAPGCGRSRNQHVRHSDRDGQDRNREGACGLDRSH